MSVRLRPEAAAEVRAARAWYARQRPGLGDEFASELRAVVEGIARGPRAFPTMDQSVDIRRALFARFPYAAFFIEREDAIWVIAVAHLRRDPGYWRRL